MSMKITPKNWKQFQHYTDRKPAWIKLHRFLLDDYSFHCLPIASKALAPCLWLLASEYENGTIDATEEEIAFRLRMSRDDLRKAFKPLVDNGFFSTSSVVLADCYQGDSLEKEIELEKEKERKVYLEGTSRAKRGTRLPPDWQPKEHLDRPEELEKFRDYWIAQPGMKGTKVDWDATWRNWIRNARPLPKPVDKVMSLAEEYAQRARESEQAEKIHYLRGI